VELKTLDNITPQSVTNKEDNQIVEEVWLQLRNKSILTDIQIFNILSVLEVPVPED